MWRGVSLGIRERVWLSSQKSVRSLEILQIHCGARDLGYYVGRYQPVVANVFGLTDPRLRPLGDPTAPRCTALFPRPQSG